MQYLDLNKCNIYQDEGVLNPVANAQTNKIDYSLMQRRIARRFSKARYII